jgi:hypothetical protein
MPYNHIQAINGYVMKEQFITDDKFNKIYSAFFLMLFFYPFQLGILVKLIKIYETTLIYVYKNLLSKFYSSTQLLYNSCIFYFISI